MASLLRLRVLLPLAALCLGGCLSEEAISPGLGEEDPQGNVLSTSPIIQPETVKEKQWCSYEGDQRFTPVIERKVWAKKRKAIHTAWPVNYIVVRDGGKHCNSHAECLTSLSSELQKTAKGVCRTLDNFYIGRTGGVYEGRGWHVAPYWHLNGMRRTAVTVKFLEEHGSEGPSERAMRAFWSLAKSGMWGMKLSPEYKVLSMGQVYNNTNLVGKALEKALQDSSVGNTEFNQMTTWETTPDTSLPLITREEWGAKKPSKPMTKMGPGVRYIMINQGGERCFTPDDCISRIKAKQEEQLPIYGDLVENFYIGDDGHVYEGRGFSYKPLWGTDLDVEDKKYFEEAYLTIKFFGKFQSLRPSEKAIGSLKLLVNFGKSLGKIHDMCILYSLRGIYDSRFLGDEFFEIARKWTPWANELDDRLAKERLRRGDEKGFIGMVKRMDWDAKDPTKTYGKMKHPVDFVIVNDNSGRDRCFNSNECVSVMKEIQETDLERYGDVEENFYISDTGNVYEGRGWNTESHCQPKFFNRSLITVNFIGNHKEVGASTPALAAFDKLIRVGVKLGKIAPNYQFYSFRNVYDADSLLGEELKKRFEKNERWSKKLDIMAENERLDVGLLPLINHSDWSDISFEVTHHQYAEPVRYVLIGSIGERCSTHEDCVATIKKYNEGIKKGVSDNFYVGDNGLAYEGRGWMNAPYIYSKGFKWEFYYISFLGSYRNESTPSKISIFTLNRLLENGVRTQKLSPDYKIISVHQVFKSGTVPSDNLHNAIKTWDRWTSDSSVLPDVEVTPSGNTLFVRRADWQAEKPHSAIPTLQHPVSHVVVHNVGDHCIDMSSCARAMQTIQKNTPPRYKDVPDNFYVGEDGHIYEGRGWHHYSLWATKGVGNNSLSVAFLGSSEAAPPSPKALLAFQILQQAMLITGALKHDYKIISLGDIVKDIVTVSEKLISALNATDRWSDDFDLKFDRARLRSLTSPFVLSDEWNLSKVPIRMSLRTYKPLRYIVIRSGGASCYTNVTCAVLIRKEHEDGNSSEQHGVTENFYIGDDGNVYEGTGWDWDMLWSFDGWELSASVQFLGNYEGKLPSTSAIEAFKAVIIRDGVATGKLLPNYKIVPFPEGHGPTLGSMLRENIKKWQNSAVNIVKN